MIKVVCFDLGGVLVRITVDMADAARRAGIQTTANPGSFLNFPPFIEFQAGRVGEDEYLDALGGLLGVSASDALSAHNHILVAPYEQTHELVQELAANGLLCACLSNTNAPHWREMRETDRFPNVRDLPLGVASHEHAMEKPRAEFYQRFREMASVHLGSRVEPHEVAFFDDTAANVNSARALGWRAWQIDPAGDPAVQMREALTSLLF